MTVWDGLVEQRRAERRAESARLAALERRTAELVEGFAAAAENLVGEATGATDMQVRSCKTTLVAACMTDPDAGLDEMKKTVEFMRRADGTDRPRDTDDLSEQAGGKTAEVILTADGLPVRVQFYGHVGTDEDSGRRVAREHATAVPCRLTEEIWEDTAVPVMLWGRATPLGERVGLSAAVDAQNGHLPSPSFGGAERLREEGAAAAEKYGLMHPYRSASAAQGFGAERAGTVDALGHRVV